MLKYHIPHDPDKEKEPLLNEEMCRKYLQPKLDQQCQGNEKQSSGRAAYILSQHLEERAKETKINLVKRTEVMLMKHQLLKFYAANTRPLEGKEASTKTHK